MSRFALDVNGIDMCVLRDNIYVLGYYKGFLIHEYSSSGSLVRSFAEAPGESEVVRSMYLVGGAHVSCVSDGDIVLVASSIRPVISAFAPDGASRWTYLVRAFQQIRIATSARSVTLDAGHSPIDNIESVFVVGRRVVGVQVRRGIRADGANAKAGTIETVLIRQDDGAEVGSQTGLQVMHRAGSRRFAALEVKSPAPVVRLYPLVASEVRP